MDKNINLIVNSILLLLAIGGGSALVRADVDVFVSAEDSINDTNTDSSRGVVWYKTTDGIFSLQATNGATYSYSPADGLSGYQFFTAEANAVGGSVATATAETATGLLNAYALAGPPLGTRDRQSFATPRIDDSVTFTNLSSNSVPITVHWHIDGTLMAGSFPNANAYHDSLFDFGLGTIGGRVNSDGKRHQNGLPEDNYDTYSVTGWDQVGSSYEVVPNSGDSSGLSFTGTCLLPPGQTTVSITTYASIAARFPNSVADFGDTAGLEFDLPSGVSFTSASGLLSEGSRLLNISTRADVLTGDSVAIAGFIVTGEDPKQVIIRGIGPSLGDQGVSGVLSDTTLELHHTDEMGNDEVLATNDNWQDTQESEIEETGIPPTDPLESAIVRTLDPGFYTAILRGKNSATGVGLIEVYDLESALNARLANISTRAFVESGDNVLIGGFIGGGNGSQPRVLIRAIGPSLADAGVADALEDPVLELHDAQGLLVTTNDDWQSDQKDEIEATGIPPTDPKESAILATLLPTNYTAIVRGADDTTGVALVEVYHLQ